jgi:hypothetical protein
VVKWRAHSDLSCLAIKHSLKYFQVPRLLHLAFFGFDKYSPDRRNRKSPNMVKTTSLKQVMPATGGLRHFRLKKMPWVAFEVIQSLFQNPVAAEATRLKLHELHGIGSLTSAAAVLKEPQHKLNSTRFAQERSNAINSIIRRRRRMTFAELQQWVKPSPAALPWVP